MTAVLLNSISFPFAIPCLLSLLLHIVNILSAFHFLCALLPLAPHTSHIRTNFSLARCEGLLVAKSLSFCLSESDFSPALRDVELKTTVILSQHTEETLPCLLISIDTSE